MSTLQPRNEARFKQLGGECCVAYSLSVMHFVFPLKRQIFFGDKSANFIFFCC